MNLKLVPVMFLVLIPLISGCAGNPAMIDAQKIISYNQHKYDNMSASGIMLDGVRVINVTIRNFSYSPDVIIVNQGERVELVLNAIGAPQGFEAEGMQMGGYNANTVINPGSPVTISFSASTAGEWIIHSPVYSGFGHDSMTGIFVVRGSS